MCFKNRLDNSHTTPLYFLVWLSEWVSRNKWPLDKPLQINKSCVKNVNTFLPVAKACKIPAVCILTLPRQAHCNHWSSHLCKTDRKMDQQNFRQAACRRDRRLLESDAEVHVSRSDPGYWNGPKGEWMHDHVWLLLATWIENSQWKHSITTSWLWLRVWGLHLEMHVCINTQDFVQTAPCTWDPCARTCCDIYVLVLHAEWIWQVTQMHTCIWCWKIGHPNHNQCHSFNPRALNLRKNKLCFLGKTSDVALSLTSFALGCPLCTWYIPKLRIEQTASCTFTYSNMIIDQYYDKMSQLVVLLLQAYCNDLSVSSTSI